MTYIWLFLLGFITSAIVCFVISYFKKPKTYGTIIMFDTDSMYLELDYDKALTEIYDSNYATFRVKHKDPQK